MSSPPPALSALKLSYADLVSPTFLASRGKRPAPPTTWGGALATMALVPPLLLALSPLIAFSQLAAKLRPAPPPARSLLPAAGSLPPVIPHAEREWDVVILGATGFTGDLALQYIMREYAGKGMKVAVAGRNGGKLQSKLLSAAEKAGCPDEFRDAIGRIVVDTGDGEQLAAMAKSARVVMSTVGPFAVYGSGVVEACAAAGTHYCDITGETQWVRENVLLLSGTAEKTGAKLVSLCGHDSIPWDLSTVMLAKSMPAGEELESVAFADEIKSAPSGGTVATLIDAIEGKTSRDMSAAAKFKGDPMNYGASDKKTRSVLPFNPFAPKESPLDGGKLGFFVMSAVNGDTVKRSVAVQNIGGGRIQYTEGLQAPDWKSAVATSLKTIASLAVIAAGPVRGLLMGKAIPSPGQGPSVKQQQQGFLRVTGEATGSKGTKVRSAFYFDVDPGYKDTSRMLAESAITLLEGGADGVGGGVYTPGAAMPDMLLERLCKTGSAWAVEVEAPGARNKL